MLSKSSFEDRLRRRGYERIGAGYFSNVFAKPNSKSVIKVGEASDSWRDYVTWGAEHGFAGNICPLVYSIRDHGDFYTACMERLHTFSFLEADLDLQEWYKGIECSMYTFSYQRADHFCMISIEMQFFLDHCRTMGWTDIKPSNFMVRDDGSLVCIDPAHPSGSFCGGWRRDKSKKPPPSPAHRHLWPNIADIIQAIGSLPPAMRKIQLTTPSPAVL